MGNGGGQGWKVGVARGWGKLKFAVERGREVGNLAIVDLECPRNGERENYRFCGGTEREACVGESEPASEGGKTRKELAEWLEKGGERGEIAKVEGGGGVSRWGIQEGRGGYLSTAEG